MTDGIGRIEVELSSPAGRLTDLKVDLDHVRAASSLYISFDLERDGWRIGMDATVYSDTHIDTVEENVERAFIPAWCETPQGGTMPALQPVVAAEVAAWHTHPDGGYVELADGSFCQAHDEGQICCVDRLLGEAS